MHLKPEEPDPNLIAGKILNLLGREDLAEREFQLALSKCQALILNAEVNWKKSSALRSMGEIYYEMGDKKLALQYFQKAYDFSQDSRSKRKIKDLIMTISNK